MHMLTLASVLITSVAGNRESPFGVEEQHKGHVISVHSVLQAVLLSFCIELQMLRFCCLAEAIVS